MNAINGFNVECIPGARHVAANAVMSALMVETDTVRREKLMEALAAIEKQDHFYDEE